MSWPTPLDYQESLQNLRSALGDPELQAGRVETDQLGLPRPRGGAFASVYKVICASRTCAVRCFLKDFKDQEPRYAAISRQLAASKFTFATHFEFLKNGVRIRGTWYPIIKMDWVEGEDLIRFVENNLSNPSKLHAIAVDIVEVAKMLNQAGAAHCDLQHGNILISNGKPKLIDYDGMFVPALKGWKTNEAGHPNYQLDRNDSHFGPGLDNFSVWVIYLSLRALCVRPILWKQLKGGDDCLLFRRSDFENPTKSAILGELRSIPDQQLKSLAFAFQSLFTRDPLNIPFLNLSSPTVPSNPSPSGSWIDDYLPAKLPSQPNNAAMAPEVRRILEIPRPPKNFNIVPVQNVRARPWLLLANPPTAPAVPAILISPPDLPAFRAPPLQFSRTTVTPEWIQKAIGIILVTFVLLFPIATMAAVGFGYSKIGNPVANAALIGGSIFAVVLFFGIWWTALELERRKEEAELNSAFEEEQLRLVEMKNEHVNRCREELKRQLSAAQKQYDAAVSNWNAKMAPYRAEAERRRQAVTNCRVALKAEQEKWAAASDSVNRLFEQRLSEAYQLNAKLDDTDRQRQVEFKAIMARAKEAQMASHLRMHLLEFAAIPEIGPKRKKALKTNGVLTAEDVSVNRISRIPKFGPTLTRSVIEWRRNIESTFIFRTSHADTIIIAEFNARYEGLRQKTLAAISALEAEVRNLSDHSATQLEHLAKRVADASLRLAQAESDILAIPAGL